MGRLIRRVAGIALLLGLACTPAPEGSEYWNQVQRELESGDYIDTLNYIADVLRSENGFNQRAAVLRVVILGAMARAALEIEDACSEGVHRVAAWDSQPYKNCIEQFRFQARTRTLGLIDAVNQLETLAPDATELTLDYPLPEAAEAASSIVGRTAVGAMPVEKVFEQAVARVSDRQFVLQTRDLIGEQEFEAAVTRFASRPVTVSRAVFLLGVARTLIDAARLFEEDRLNDEPTRKAVLEHARACLTSALEGADAELKSRAQKLQREIAAG